MPYAKVALGSEDISINFRMRDRTSYCARPRKISEEIAVMYIVWDVSSRDSLKDTPQNSTFCCEIEMRGGCIPHTIFGPQHRIRG